MTGGRRTEYAATTRRAIDDNAYFTLTDDNGWSLDKAEQWLHESLRAALL